MDLLKSLRKLPSSAQQLSRLVSALCVPWSATQKECSWDMGHVTRAGACLSQGTASEWCLMDLPKGLCKLLSSAWLLSRLYNMCTRAGLGDSTSHRGRGHVQPACCEQQADCMQGSASQDGAISGAEEQ